MTGRATVSLGELRDRPAWEWPPDAAATMLAIVHGTESGIDDLLLAVELASEVVVMNDELAGALIEIVQAPSRPEQLRVEAALALGPMLEYATDGGYEPDGLLEEEPEVTPPTIERAQAVLHAAYLDAAAPLSVRRSALEASVRGDQDWHEAAVRDAWASADESWRATGLFCMQYLAGFDEEIVKALSSQDQRFLCLAVQVAGAWGLDQALPVLVSLLRSSETPRPLLLAAIEAAPRVNPDVALELLAPLVDHPDEEVASAAEGALAMAEADLALDDEDDEDDDGSEMPRF
jgi:hypothetical protein